MDEHLCAPLLRLPEERVVSVCGSRRRTGAALRSRVAALVQLLRCTLGVRPGEVVALATGTSDSALEAWLAVAACGALAAPLNTRWCVRAPCSFSVPALSASHPALAGAPGMLWTLRSERGRRCCSSTLPPRTSGRRCARACAAEACWPARPRRQGRTRARRRGVWTWRRSWNMRSPPARPWLSASLRTASARWCSPPAAPGRPRLSRCATAAFWRPARPS